MGASVSTASSVNRLTDVAIIVRDLGDRESLEQQVMPVLIALALTLGPGDRDSNPDNVGQRAVKGGCSNGGCC